MTIKKSLEESSIEEKKSDKHEFVEQKISHKNLKIKT